MNQNDFKEIIMIDNISDKEYPVDTNSDLFKWSSRILYTGTVDLTKIKFDKEYVPKNGDKLFFYPGCTIPRYKVRDWASRNGMSVTIKEEKADVKFASEKTIMESISINQHRKVEKANFITWLGMNYDNTRNDIVELIKDIQNNQENYVYLHESFTHTYWADKYLGLGNTYSTNIKVKLSSLDDTVNKKSFLTIVNDIQTIENILRPSVDVCASDSLIQIINKDSILIDNEMYERLCGMLESTNKADNVMAIEIIANCNINPSLHFVLLLLQKYYSIILNMKESNHINFRSLLEYIGITRSSMTYISNDDIISHLIDKNVLLYDTVKELSEKVKEEWKRSFDSEHFKIQTVTVSDEVKDYFKNNKQ